MTHTELDREVASRTGETLTTIRKRGFSLVAIEYPPPQVLDWDKLDRMRLGLLPDRQRRRRLPA